MDGFHVVGSLGTMIVAATVLVLILRQIYVPAIVSYIIAGLAIGPALVWLAAAFPGSLPTPEPVAAQAVDVISEVGIALLLFIVGLELSLEKIRDVGRVAVLAGLGQVAFTAVGGFSIALLLQFDLLESVFLAIAL
ncbi:MAG TPA: cation:proton antiporter, partial [Acidobacteriota bacterium]|nr:cation:proton antiporter [Acidobacteriota bacterium]